MATRSRTLRFRASEPEEHDLKARAEQAGLTLSDFLRRELGLKANNRQRVYRPDDPGAFKAARNAPGIDELLYQESTALEPKLEEQAKLMETETGDSLTVCRLLIQQQAQR